MGQRKYHVYEGGIEVVDDLTETLGSDYYILKAAPLQEAGDLCRVRRHGKHPDPVFDLLAFV
ncbi:hypothetical protein ACEQPO_05635 [Bacillus sp. SL00103]